MDVINLQSYSRSRGDGKNYREIILRKLQERNNKGTNLCNLINQSSKLYETLDLITKENIRLKARIQTGMLDGPSDGGNERALERKIITLQEELTDLHRNKSENAQNFIDLKNRVEEKDRQLSKKDHRIDELESELSVLKKDFHKLREDYNQLQTGNTLLKDEYSALGMHNSSLESKHLKLEKDYNDIIERMLQAKALDAQILNDECEEHKRKVQRRFTQQFTSFREEGQQAVDPLLSRPRSLTSPQVTLLGNEKPTVSMAVSIPSKMNQKFDAHEGEVNAIKCSQSGNLVATGGGDRKIKLWNLLSTPISTKSTFTGSNAAITSIDFSPEEGLILGACNDFASRIWTTEDSRLRHTLTGHSGKVLAAKFMGDPIQVVTGSYDRTLKIWDLRSRACIKTIFAGSSCSDVVTTYQTIISGHHDKKIRFWDAKRDSTSHEILLQGKITSLDLSPDSSFLLCCVRDDTLKCLDLRMNQVFNTLSCENFKVGCDWSRAKISPDGQYAIAGSNDGTVFIWNIHSGKMEKMLKEHTSCITACTWHPSGSYILSCDKKNKVVVWSGLTLG